MTMVYGALPFIGLTMYKDQKEEVEEENIWSKPDQLNHSSFVLAFSFLFFSFHFLSLLFVYSYKICYPKSLN